VGTRARLARDLGEMPQDLWAQ